MFDFINKVISLFLIFILLVFAPMLLSYKTEDMLARFEILNDVNSFIDKVTDASAISQSDIDALALQCNTHGLVVDIQVERLVYAMTTYTDTSGNKAYNYDYVVDTRFGTTSTALNQRDMIRVTVKERTYSTSRALTYKLLNVDEGKLEFQLCGMVG